MKRLLNLLGYLVSDLTQKQLAERGPCRCHKFGKELEPRCAMVDVTPWRPHDW